MSYTHFVHTDWINPAISVFTLYKLLQQAASLTHVSNYPTTNNIMASYSVVLVLQYSLLLSSIALLQQNLLLLSNHRSGHVSLLRILLVLVHSFLLPDFGVCVRLRYRAAHSSRGCKNILGMASCLWKTFLKRSRLRFRVDGAWDT